MNIEEIKVRIDNLSKRGFEGFEAKEHFHANAESDIDYLLSIIETVEKALTYYAEEPYLVSIGYSMNAIEALQVIRGK